MAMNYKPGDPIWAISKYPQRGGWHAGEILDLTPQEPHNDYSIVVYEHESNYYDGSWGAQEWQLKPRTDGALDKHWKIPEELESGR